MIADARRYSRDIAAAFTAKGVPPLLAFVLAMSKSKFKADGGSPAASGEVGLWRTPSTIVREYLKQGESPAAAGDPRRAAQIAADYMKDLLAAFPEFSDDFVYAVACYGMSIREAAQVRSRLEQAAPEPAARGDFWKMVELGIVPQEGVDRVARFFAAGIVAENPRRFNLPPQALSSLY